jgi:large subunit ribosomal protein L17
MRHKKSFNHLSRKSAHRDAMLANLASSLILHKRIHTTTAKAKALRRYIEPLITRSRNDSTHSRRVVFSYLQDKEAVSELFREVAVKVGERPGGYTRIIRIGNRQGDNADMCMMELVDYNPTMLAEKAATRKTTRRRRGGRGRAAEKKAERAAAPEAEASEAAEAEVAPEAETTEAPAAEAAPETPEAGEPETKTDETETETEKPEARDTETGEEEKEKQDQ